MIEPTQAALTAAGKLGYARGYNAGKKLVKRQAADEKLRREREAFRRRVFLAALPAALGTVEWKRGDAPIRSLKDRVKLAVEFADEAMRHF